MQTSLFGSDLTDSADSCNFAANLIEGDLKPSSQGRSPQATTAAHLRAARRLSKAIRAQKADPERQTATGLAICGHLLALLEDSEPKSGQRSVLHKL